MSESNLNIPLPSQKSVSEVESCSVVKPDDTSAISESEKPENVKLLSSKIAKHTGLKLPVVAATGPPARTGRLCNNILKPAVPPNPVPNESVDRGGGGGGGEGEGKTMSTSSIRRVSDELARKRLADVHETDENAFPDFGNGKYVYDRKMSSGSVLSDSSRKSDELRKKRISDASTSADSYSDYYKNDFEPRRSSDASVVLTEDTDQFIIGDRVWVGGVKPGQIAYIGETQFAPGEWAGVVLDEPIGKNDGTVANIRYFQCEPKKGIFSRLTRLTRYPLVEGGAEEASVARPESRRSNGSLLASVPKKSSLVLTGSAGPKTSISKPPSPDSSVHPNIQLGDRVIVKSSQGSKAGILRYLGTTEFAAGEWCGVELDDPLGKNDGSVSGTRYFECRPQFGLFAPLHKVSKSPANKRPSQGNCAIHNRGGATTPGIRRHGSKESLVSISSNASTAASIKSTSRKIGVRTPTTPTSAKNALQETLKQKELHIEQLLKERDLERAEVTRAASQADEAERRLVALKQEFEQQKEETEARVSDLDALTCLLKSENEELKNILEDERKKYEDLLFRFEEETIDKADIKSTWVKYEEKLRAVENALFEERKRAEALELDSNKLFEAEEQMVIVKDELDLAREEIAELKKMRSTLEQEHISLEAQLTSSRAEIESLKIENESLKSSASQDQSNSRENLAQVVQAYEECKQELERNRREAVELSKNLEMKDKSFSEKQKEIEAKHLEIVNELTEKHQFEIENRLKELKDLKQNSESKLTFLETELEEKIKMCNDLEIQLHEVSMLLSKATGEKFAEENNQKKTADKFQKLKETAEEILKKNERLTEEVAKKEMLIQEKQKLEEELAESRKTLNGIIENQKKELEKYKTENDSKSEECEFLRKSLATKKEEEERRLKERDAVIIGINAEVEKLKKELVKQKEEEEFKSEEIKQLYEAHEGDYKRKIKQLEGLSENRRKEVEALDRDLENVKSALAATESHLESEQTKSKDLVEKLTALEENHKMILLERDQMLLEAGDKTGKLHSLEEKLSHLTNQKAKLQSDISNFINSSNDSSLQLTKLNEDLRSKETEMDVLREEILQKSQNFERVEQALKQTLKSQEAEMKTVKEELESVKRDSRLEAEALKEKLADSSARLNAADVEWRKMIEVEKSDFESRIRKLEEEKMLMEKKELDDRIKYENEIKKLKSAEDELRGKLSEAEESRNLVEKKIEDAILERKNLIESFEKTKTEFLENEKQIKEKGKKDAEILVSENEKLRNELKETARILATTVEKFTKAKSEKNKLNEEKSKLDGTTSTLEVLLKELHATYSEMEENAISIKSENQGLKDSLSQLTKEKNLLEENFTENQIQLTELRSQLEASDYSKKSREVETEEKIRILEAEASELRTKFQKTETAHAAEDSIKSKLIIDLKNEVDRLKVESSQVISEKEGTIENLNALVSQLRKESEDKKFEQERNCEEIEKIEKKFEQASQELHSEKRKCEEYEKRLTALEAEKVDLKERIEEKSNKLVDRIDLESKLAEVTQKLGETEKKERETAKNAELEKETFENLLKTTKSLLNQKEKDASALKKEIEVLEEEKLNLVKNSRTLMEAFEKEKAELLKQLEETKVKSEKEQKNLNPVALSENELQEEREFQRGQVDFLNSVIVDMQKKNDALKARIEILEMGFSPEDVDEFDLQNITTRSVAPRLFCDICDRFDLHDTEDCPTQANEDVPPPKSSKVKVPPPERPYCEICEAFGHDTADCDDGETF